MAKIYSDEEIQRLSENPCVLRVSRHQLVLTLEFRQAIYDKWVISPTLSTIRSILEANGFNMADIGKNFVGNMRNNFKEYGQPKRSRGSAHDAEGDVYERSGTETFIETIYTESTTHDQKQVVPSIPPEVAESLRANPYVSEVASDGIELNDKFFSLAASFSGIPVDDILEVFLITPSLLTVIQKTSISERLSKTVPMRWGEVDTHEGTLLEYEILRRREAALVRAVSDGYEKIRETISRARPSEKKKICLLLDALPKDPANEFTKVEILKRIGMSRTSYYMYVGKEDFGTSEMTKLERDKKDSADVRMVFEYKGFRKGNKTVTLNLHKTV